MMYPLFKLLTLWAGSILVSRSTQIEKNNAITQSKSIHLTSMPFFKNKSIVTPIQHHTKKLTNLYILAIQDFINVMYQNKHTTFDTIFINKRKLGNPDDFPDVQLPQKINGVTIILLPQDTAYTLKKIKSFHKKKPLINLIGWVENDKAEFIFVAFFPMFHHQYDCNLQYIFNKTQKNYHLENFSINLFSNDTI